MGNLNYCSAWCSTAETILSLAFKIYQILRRQQHIFTETTQRLLTWGNAALYWHHPVNTSDVENAAGCRWNQINPISLHRLEICPETSEDQDLWLHLMMIYYLQVLLLWGSQLVPSSWALTAPTDPNKFFYHNFLNGNGTKGSMYIINNNVSGLRSCF